MYIGFVGWIKHTCIVVQEPNISSQKGENKANSWEFILRVVNQGILPRYVLILKILTCDE